MGQRTCRRPRPAEPPPFGPRDEKKAAYYFMRRNRSPRRPRPLVAPPAPSLVAENTSSCTSIVVVAPPAKTGVSSNMGFVSSEALYGDDRWRAPPEGRSQSCLGPGKDGGKDGKRSKRAEAEGSFAPSRLNTPSFVENDPLMHSGRWVPAEHGLCKELPWTGYWTCCGHKSSFTTHCLDFGARMQQREADHQRDLAGHATRARQAVAENTRARWKSREQRANTSSMDILDSDGSTAKRAAAGDHPNRRTGREARPFLRKKWLERLGELKGAPPGDAADSEPNIRSDGSSSGGGGGGRLGDSQRNQPVVQRDHVRSVVQLALSESRVNAFVAISCLKGLLAVATEGLGGGGGRQEEMGGGSGLGDETKNGMVVDESLPGFPPVSNRSPHGSGKNDHPEARASTMKTNTCDKKRSCHGTRAERCKGRLPHNHQFGNNHSSELKKGGATTLSKSMPEKSAGRTEEACSGGGAALCVKLGALPAVLECLEEHPGHKDVEPLCVRLLHVFASDGATKGAIGGNVAVATACAARMFLTAGARTSAGLILTSSTGSGSSTGSSSNTGNFSSMSGLQAAGKGRKERLASRGESAGLVQAPAAGLQAIPEFPHGEVSSAGVDLDVDRGQPPKLDGSATAAAAAGCGNLTMAPVGLSSSSNWSAAVMSASLSGGGLTVPTGCEPGFLVAARENADMRKAANLPGGEYAGVNPRETDKALQLPQTDLRPPPTDLLFVLSVAVQNSRDCQELVLRQGGMVAMLGALKWTEAASNDVGGGGARRTEICLTVLGSLGEGEQGRRRLIKGGVVESAVSAIETFRSHHGVLAAAMALLLVLSGSPAGRGRILKVGGVRVILEAMQRLVGSTEVQWKGADMIRTLISEQPQARRELDSIRGGWQWLCQGTPGGDALVRYAPGERHIAGWTASEEERLTTKEALAKAELIASEWTPYNLATFMGTTRNHHKLQVGNLANHHFFRVVSEAGLLPLAHEDAHQWNARLRRYEDERDIRVSHIARRRLGRDSSGAHATSLASSSVPSS